MGTEVKGNVSLSGTPRGGGLAHPIALVTYLPEISLWLPRLLGL